MEITSQSASPSHDEYLPLQKYRSFESQVRKLKSGRIHAWRVFSSLSSDDAAYTATRTQFFEIRKKIQKALTQLRNAENVEFWYRLSFQKFRAQTVLEKLRLWETACNQH